MAAFNPNAPEVNTPDFTNRSQGIGNSKIFSTLFGGISDTATAYGKHRDTEIQRQIYDDTVAKRNAAAQPFVEALDAGGYTKLADGTVVPAPGAAGPGGGAGGTPLGDGKTIPPNVDPTIVASVANSPPEIKAAGVQMTKLQSALEAGTVSQAYYDAQLLSISKGLRMKYPGYGQEVDATIKTVTGRDPANALVGDFYEEARANATNANSAESKWETWSSQKENMAAIGITTPDYFTNPQKYSSPEARMGIKARASTYFANNAVKADEEARIRLKAARGADVKEDVFNTSMSQASFMDTQAITTAMVGDQDLMAQLAAASKDPSTFPADKIPLINATAGQMRLQTLTAANKYLDSVITEDGRTRRSFMSQAQVDEFTKASTSHIDNILDSLNHKDYGMAHYWANKAKVTQEKDVDTLLSNSLGARVIAATNAVGGQAAVDRGISQGGKFADAAKQFYGESFDIIAAGEPAARIVTTVDELQKGIKGTPEEVKKQVGAVVQQHLKNVLTSIQTTKDPKVIANEVGYLFDEKNAAFLQTYVPEEQRAAVYAQMTSPGVSQAIAAATKDNPKLWDQYRTWAARSFQSQFTRQAADVQKGVTGGKYIKYGWDPNTSQITYKIDPNNPYAQLQNLNTIQRGFAVLGMSVDDVNRGIISNNAVTAIKDINTQLRSVAEIAKISGEDPGKVLLQVLHGMGVDFNGKEEGSFLNDLPGAIIDGITGTVKGAVDKAGENRQKVIDDLNNLNPFAPTRNFTQPGAVTSGRSPAEVQQTAQTIDLSSNPADDRFAGIQMSHLTPTTAPVGILAPTDRLFGGAPAGVADAVSAVSKITGGNVAPAAPSGVSIAKLTGSNPTAVAKSYLGQNEADHTKTISAFIKEAAGIDINPAKTAWCAAWANAVLAASGYAQGRGDGSKGSVGNGMWAWDFETYGTDARKDPQEGDVVTFRFANGGGHVGFFMGYSSDGKYVKVLGGNQGGAAQKGGGVTITLEPISTVSAIRRPAKMKDDQVAMNLEGHRLSTNIVDKRTGFNESGQPTVVPQRAAPPGNKGGKAFGERDGIGAPSGAYPYDANGNKIDTQGMISHPEITPTGTQVAANDKPLPTDAAGLKKALDDIESSIQFFSKIGRQAPADQLNERTRIKTAIEKLGAKKA